MCCRCLEPKEISESIDVLNGCTAYLCLDCLDEYLQMKVSIDKSEAILFAVWIYEGKEPPIVFSIIKNVIKDKYPNLVHIRKITLGFWGNITKSDFIQLKPFYEDST